MRHLTHNLDITGGSAMKKPRGGDADDELSFEWYIKLFLGVHFADNLA